MATPEHVHSKATLLQIGGALPFGGIDSEATTDSSEVRIEMTGHHDNEQWRPDERPDQTPTHPYDPDNADSKAWNPPLPPDADPQAPVREPNKQPPVGDPPPNQPRRLV